MNTEVDYSCEMLGMKRALKLGINIPNVIATSYIEDKYLFRYIIMDYINGVEAGNILKQYSPGEKVDFVRQLKGNISKMNTIMAEKISWGRGLKKKRWQTLDGTYCLRKLSLK